MQLMIDSANVQQIEKALGWGFIDGVTTNPTILARELSGTQDCSVSVQGNVLLDHLVALRKMLGSDRSLHVQVSASDCVTMVKEGLLIADRLGSDTYVKVPVTDEGLRAIKALHDHGIKVTATAVTSVMQGLLASYAGADYVAIYYSRMKLAGLDAFGIAKALNERFSKDLRHTRMLAASFRTPEDIAECYSAGAECCTVKYSLLEQALSNPVTNEALDAFSCNWDKVFGKPYTELY